MELTFLRASDGTPLTKTFEQTSEGIVKSSYPNVRDFLSYDISVTTLEEFYELLASVGPTDCLLKGNVDRPLTGESRAGSTDPDALTSWLCYDVDGSKTCTSAAQFTKRIGMTGVSYIEQQSCSAGIDIERGYSAHIYVFLKEPTSPHDLKVWLKYINLQYFRDEITLNKAGTALRYPVDISTCQNDKLLYVAPPICKGFEAPKSERIKLVKRRLQRLTTDFSNFDKLEVARMEHEVVNELRAAKGLKKTPKLKGDVLVNPEPAVVTEYKVDRGFVYLNLNGGDSFGYYFPEDNPDILYNFKGEPNVKLEKLDPAFYSAYIQTSGEEAKHQSDEVAKQPSDEEDQGTQYFVAVDKRDAIYYNVTYDRATEEAEIIPIRSRDVARNFLKAHGQPIPDFFPIFEEVFDITGGIPRVDFAGKQFNTYVPTSYIKNSTQYAEPPPLIKTVLLHVVGGDEDVLEHFLNWLACIIQRALLTLTAWVLTGTQGTGKGLLFDTILTPIFGFDYCSKMQLSQFDGPWNDSLKFKQLILIDEAQISDVRESKAMAGIKETIATHQLAIRQKFRNTQMYPNFANFIIASNKFDSVQVDMNDRRFNVAPRQETPIRDIIDIEGINERLKAELQQFTDYLMHRDIDEKKAITVLQTSERSRLMHTTENSIEMVSRHVKEGDFDYFLDCFMESEDRDMEFQDRTKLKNSTTFKEVLEYMYSRNGTFCNLSLTQLHLLFFYTIDHVRATNNRFSASIKHKGFEFDRMNVNGVTAVGVRIPKIVVKDEQRWLQIAKPSLKAVGR